MFQPRPDEFNSVGTKPIVFVKKMPLAESFGLAAKEPELEPEPNIESEPKPEPTINEQILEQSSGQYIPDTRFAVNHTPISPEGQKEEKEKEHREFATRYLIKGYELTVNQIADNLMKQANQLSGMLKLGDDYFGRVPTAKDKLYVIEKDGQITFASMNEKGARVANAQEKSTLEAQNKMCIIGLSSDEVVEEVVVDLGGGKSYTKPAYIKTHANEKDRMITSIEELEMTAEKLKSGEITPDQLTPYAQHLAAPEAFENTPAPPKQPLVLDKNDLLPPAPAMS